MSKRFIVAALVLLPSALAAQSRGGEGFLFRRPSGSISIRAGAARPNASGSIFSEVSRLLMPRGATNTKQGLAPNDFIGVTGAVEISAQLSQRSELVFGASLNRRAVPSEYRDWVDNKDQPIEQRTQLDRIPTSLGLKWNLVPAGRSISRLVWVPSRVVPYVAVGGGAMWWRFKQNGDFIDYLSPAKDVFRSTLQDRGWTPMAYGAAGIAWNVRPSVALTGEARYDAAKAPLRGDFENFGNINLSGIGLSAGIQLRY